MSARATVPARVDARFRSRVVLSVVILGVVAVAATAAGSTYLMWSVLDEGLANVAKTLGQAKSRLVGEARTRTERALAAMVIDLTERENPFLERAAETATRTDRRVTRAAADFVRLTGVDTVEIVDREGIVLSSAHWPEGAGFPHDDVIAWAARPGHESPLPVDLPTATGEAPALVTLGTAGDTRGEVVLLAGMILDGELLDGVYPETPAAIVDPEGRIVAENGLWPAGVAPEDLRPLLGDNADRPIDGSIVRLADGSVSMVAGQWLRERARDGATCLLVLADVTEHGALKRRLAWMLAGVGLVVLFLAVAAGVWVGRAVTRPLDEMVRAVDAVSRGEADYSFSLPGRDGLAVYVESFSRMTRALEYERKRLRAVERVAAWREAARRVAHEVKNPLVPIRLSVENLVKARQRAPERFEEMFDEATGAILEEVERLRRIVTEFSDYARLPEPRPRVGDLNELVDSVVSLYTGDDKVRLRREQDGTIPPFAFDPDLIAQAVKNVLANAVEAVEGQGGAVSVRTFLEDDLAAVEVSDDGPGIPEADRDRVFDPYFTTKSEGTGLGLAITSRIVTEHGGVLSAEGRPERGTRVVIRLPLGGRESSPDRVAGVEEENA
jgi:signal transduction histidine kinase